MAGPVMKAPLLLALLLTLSLGLAGSAPAASLTVQDRSPSALTVRLSEAEPGALYSITYSDGSHHFVWDNLSPDSGGLVRLADDKHLRPEYRLLCESRTFPGDPVVFDDLLKGPIVGKRRLPFGVPVSTFGGPGYLVPGAADLCRDDSGRFWLSLDHPPYTLLNYGPDFSYRFALLLPDAPIAFDTDADDNLYVLHPGNWISKHGPLGESLGAWDLPWGRGPGEFVSASGMVIDSAGRWLYLADEILGRVQRFDLDLKLSPFPQIVWGWIGRQDLAYTAPGRYDGEQMYYQLDRPRQLALDDKGHLFVSCEDYISKFDLTTGRQLQFGRNPVLGWGGTFSDSPFSPSAALDGHWQRHWLAGVDRAGNIYVADRENEYVVNPRLQVFDSDGILRQSLDLEDEFHDGSGAPVYLGRIRSLAFSDTALWLVDPAGRIYQSPSGRALQDGGRLFLGPGAAGRQFDLSRVNEAGFSVEKQSARLAHHSEGKVLGWPAGDRGSMNCEREGSPVLRVGARSMWVPARIGEPFSVTLFDGDDRLIPAADYRLEFEQQPGLFGTQYDFFRVTNASGRTWTNVSFVAESLP